MPVEMLHTATLVHDDVIDGALAPRCADAERPLEWRLDRAGGNYLFGMAARFAETRNMRAIELSARRRASSSTESCAS